MLAGETARKDVIVFFVFFCPQDERKNPDWPHLFDYSICPSDWKATCHLRAWSPLTLTFNNQGNISNYFRRKLYDLRYQIRT